MPVNLRVVANEGVPPLRLGMSAAEASEAMAIWGPVIANQPERPENKRLNAHDSQYAVDVHANLEDGEHVTSIVVWRPKGDPSGVVFEGVDLFAQEASTILEELRRRGYALNDDDPFFPRFDEISLAFNRDFADVEDDDGDEDEDEGVARFFSSVTIAATEN